MNLARIQFQYRPRLRPESFVILASLAAAAVCGCAAPGGDQPVSAAARPAPPLMRMLTEPGRSPSTRLDAARMLLERCDGETIEWAARILAAHSNRPASIALARAVGETGRTSTALVDPLLEMLADGNPTARGAAAEALGAYRADSVRRRLADLARDPGKAADMRRAAIAAIGRRPDRQSVTTLLPLLSDSDPAVRLGASKALAGVTGIRRFGADERAWRDWWHDNKDISPGQWLADLTERLARLNAEQARRIDALSGRLAESTERWCDMLPQGQRGPAVLTLLRDPVAHLRLLGTRLAVRHIAAGEPLPDQTPQAVRALLDDTDARVRAAAADVAAGLSDTQAVEILIRRLGTETDSDARVAVLDALGRLGAAAATDDLLASVADPRDPIAAAAAGALARMTSKSLLSAQTVRAATAAIIRRYGQPQPSPQLREALLGAMEDMAQPIFTPVMRAALTDPVAAVRLAAVHGLQTMAFRAAADDIAGLMATDPDRAVRQTAIAAMETLGSVAKIDAVLARTEVAAESDPSVRTQAWETALALLAEADNDRLQAAADRLTGRPDAREYRIRLLERLVERAAERPARRAGAQSRLASALLDAGRPAQVAKVLAQAHEDAVDAAAKGRLWLQWIAALLADEDPACLALMAEQANEQLFATAAEQWMKHLDELAIAGDYSPLIALADRAAELLSDKLTPRQLAAAEALAAEARHLRGEADRARVAQLADGLTSSDPAERDKAARTLKTLGTRAVEPLVRQLRQVVGANPAKPEAEAAIIALLAEIAPQLTDYDTAKASSEKIAIIDGWLKKQSP